MFGWLEVVLAVLTGISTVLGIRAKYKEGKAKETAERNREIVNVVVDGVEDFKRTVLNARRPVLAAPDAERVNETINKTIGQRATASGLSADLDSVLVHKGYKGPS